MERQALLIARWMHVGFVHGVMNTDNTALSGETIDFGPCAFMDSYDPATAFSAIDEFGRYAYANQPTLRNGISRGSPRPCFRSWIPTQSGRSNLRARRSPPTPLGELNRAFLPVDADDRTRWPDRLGDQKSDVTRPRAEVKHAHARPDAALPDQSARKSFDTQRLQLQALEFGLGPWIKVRPVRHERTPP